MGKFVVIGLLMVATAAGYGIWHTNHSAYWEPMEDVTLTAVSLVNAAPEPFGASNITAVRSVSSPLGFRACFTTTASPAMLAETYQMVDSPAPTIPPNSFTCFDAEAIADGLQSGAGVAVLGHENIAYGVNRIVAVFEDGRGFAWHELNNCGKKAYDGSPVGDACPDRDTFRGSF